MRSLFGRLLSRWRDRHLPGEAPSSHTPSRTPGLAVSEKARCRALADAIDRAMEMGLLEHAQRIARTGMRIAGRSPCLAERIARLQMMLDKPKAALAMIETCQPLPSSMRLLRATCLIQLGQKAEAHSDLLHWTRQSSAPLDARLMLAMLEWDTGDDHAAMLALMRNLRHLEDPRTLELLTLLTTWQERPEPAQRWFTRLQECSAFGAGSTHQYLLAHSLGIPLPHTAAKPTDEQIEMLGMELLSAERVIGTLTEALRLKPRRDTTELLYRAIEHVLNDLTDTVSAIEALARLAILLDDRNAARFWTQRGLQLNPMRASLAVLNRELHDRGTVTDAQTADDVLATIGQHHPAPISAPTPASGDGVERKISSLLGTDPSDQEIAA